MFEKRNTPAFLAPLPPRKVRKRKPAEERNSTILHFAVTEKQAQEIEAAVDELRSKGANVTVSGLARTAVIKLVREYQQTKKLPLVSRV
ncbi:MAG: hypothetical protein HC900_03405 [Methylacidiphilales bacterium]|nr:hypothetical protein [Candidatus Methylacidiphilales bacterium]